MTWKRCLHCHAESSLAFAERALAERSPIDGDKNYPGATGALQSSVMQLLDPAVAWVMCAKHRRAQKAARAELEREINARMEADQRAWREREAAREGCTLPPDMVESTDRPTAR